MYPCIDHSPYINTQKCAILSMYKSGPSRPQTHHSSLSLNKHSPSTAPTMKLPILPSILTALLVSNAAYVHAAEVACTTDADCLAVRCPNNGRRCTTTRCVVGVCETPECTPGPGQMCRVSCGVFSLLGLGNFGLLGI